MRAILEGVAFQYVETLEIAKRLGVQVRRITMTGGEAKSRLWNQIKADVLGMDVEIPEILDAAALGACILAAVGIKAYEDFPHAVEEMVRISRVFRPEKESHEKYMKLYEAYQEVYRYYSSCFDILADVSRC